FSSRRRHTRWPRDWSSDVCSSDLAELRQPGVLAQEIRAIEIAAAIEENFAFAAKAVDQVTAELVGGENAGLGRELFHLSGGGDRSEERRVGKEWRGGGGRSQVRRG